MVFYTRDVQPVESYIDECVAQLIDGLHEIHQYDITPWRQYYRVTPTGEVVYSETFTDGLYHLAEAAEEANITGYLHEFDDDETIDIVDKAVSKVFEALDGWRDDEGVAQVITRDVMSALNRRFNSYLYD